MHGAASPLHEGKSVYRGIPFAIFVALGLIALSGGCSASRELTRGRAAELIRDSGDFNRPVSVPLLGKREQPVRARSTDESEEEARRRAIDEYGRSHVEMAAFGHLGLIDFRANLVDEPSPEHEWWRFSVEPVLTEKGEREAVEAPEARGRKGVVMARRELIEVTDLTTPKDGETRAEFTWKEVATTAGKAFDPSSETYRGLPEWIRRGVAGPPPGLGRSLERMYGVAHGGTAAFRLYDDGWRVQHIQF